MLLGHAIGVAEEGLIPMTHVCGGVRLQTEKCDPKCKNQATVVSCYTSLPARGG